MNNATATPVHDSGVRRQASRPLGLWSRLSYVTLTATVGMLIAVLGYRGMYHFGRVFGTLEWLINYKRRRRFQRVLGRLLQRKPTRRERVHLTREYFMQSRCDRVLYMILDRLPAEQAQRLFSIDGREKIDKALRRGRGAYIALCHHGPHHVAATLFAMLGYRVAGVRDRKESALRRFLQARLDKRSGEFERMRVLFADSPPRQIMRCFQENYVVGSAMDVSRVRDERQKVEIIDMFGERRPFLTGPLRLAVRCRAPVLQGVLIAEPDFRYRLRIVDELLSGEPVEEEATAIRQALERYAGHIETYMREYPHLVSRV